MELVIDYNRLTDIHWLIGLINRKNIDKLVMRLAIFISMSSTGSSNCIVSYTDGKRKHYARCTDSCNNRYEHRHSEVKIINGPKFNRTLNHELITFKLLDLITNFFTLKEKVNLSV
jgi:hypothetical protein